MKTNELKRRTQKELTDLLKDKKARVDELRWQISQKKVKNVKELQIVKKDVARILTLLRNCEL